MMATDKAGSNSDRTSDNWGSASSGMLRGMAAMPPTVGTVAKFMAVGRAGRVSRVNNTVATAMAMMKANRCKGLTSSITRISPSVSPPMVVAWTSICPIRNTSSSAWATRFEKLL